ncbi:MAG: enoyl-CoA hydratase-related protein [Candidatus Rokuibacteriota bacterium]
MEGAPVRVERAGAAVRCSLDRPPLNLFDPVLIAGLREAFVALGRDPSVGVVVLAGRGRAFTAGMNVSVLRDLDVASARALITSLHDAIDAVHAAPFPVIAEISGACLGAGFELAMACDIRVATADARLGLPEVRVGVPSVIQAALLPALVGPGRAAEMLLTGDPVSGADALAWGLVNRAVPAAALRGTVDGLVARILSCAPAAVRLQKELIIAWRRADLPAAIRAGIDVFARSYATGEPAEGARAFLEKRPPRFGERR